MKAASVIYAYLYCACMYVALDSILYVHMHVGIGLHVGLTFPSYIPLFFIQWKIRKILLLSLPYKL